MDPLRLAVVGHVEVVTIGRVPRLPSAGEITYLEDPVTLAGGGGGVSFHQLAASDADPHFFTALGDDPVGEAARAELAARGHLYAARRAAGHTRALAMIDPTGERTIVVAGEPQHPALSDPLPWEILSFMDGVYFTGQDPGTIRAARGARTLVVTARRRAALVESGVRADVVVGSGRDAREASVLADYPVRPGALVMTEGASGGRIETEAGTTRYPPAPAAPSGGGAYGAGDSFAAALTYYLAAGLTVEGACARAAFHGAAVLRGRDPRANHLRLARPR
jgi:ribokinase